MTKAEHLGIRKDLLDEAQTFIDQGDIENARAKREEVESLDAQFEREAIEMANAAALIEPEVPEVIENVIENEPIMEDEMERKIEYRDVFLKNLMGRQLDSEEMEVFRNDAIATSGAGAIVPTETQNKIIEVIKNHAPILDEITLLNVEGIVSYAMPNGSIEASKHTENATISTQSMEFTSVDLYAREYTSLVQISESVKTMTIDAFEGWLSEQLGRAIADALTAQVITAAMNNASMNNVSFREVVTAKTIQKYIAEIPSAYDKNLKFVMSKGFLYNVVLPLQDNSKTPIVRFDGVTGGAYIYGIPVLLDDYLTSDAAVLGDFTTIVGNMPQNAQIKSDFDISTNSYKYLGVAMFDCAAPLPAFVAISNNAG